jgi:hypothetical protein
MGMKAFEGCLLVAYVAYHLLVGNVLEELGQCLEGLGSYQHLVLVVIQLEMEHLHLVVSCHLVFVVEVEREHLDLMGLVLKVLVLMVQVLMVLVLMVLVLMVLVLMVLVLKDRFEEQMGLVVLVY